MSGYQKKENNHRWCEPRGIVGGKWSGREAGNGKRKSKSKKSFFTEVKRGSIVDGEGCEQWLSFKEKKAKEKVQWTWPLGSNWLS